MFSNNADTPDNQNTIYYAYQTNVNYFIAWKYDPATNMMVLFVNGEYKTVVRNTSTVDGGPLYFPAFMFWDHYGIRGVVSDVALYNRALTNTQIEHLYNLGKLD
jgi:hypothetical protein